MKIRKYKKKLVEEEFKMIKRDNTAWLLSDGALTSVKRPVKENIPTKPAYDPQLHDINSTVDSDKNHFGDQDSDIDDNETVQEILDNAAGEDLTKRVTVFVTCGKEKRIESLQLICQSL